MRSRAASPTHIATPNTEQAKRCLYSDSALTPKANLDCCEKHNPTPTHHTTVSTLARCRWERNHICHGQTKENQSMRRATVQPVRHGNQSSFQHREQHPCHCNVCLQLESNYKMNCSVRTSSTLPDISTHTPLKSDICPLTPQI